LSVNGTITGWATALMQMHIGDHWEIYVPYTLGYGTTNTNTTAGVTNIPAYSTLIFDIRLVAYWRADGDVPEMK
jgi:FKBP-type peptidyl-prolyl cis-trans isomerase FklB